MSPAGRLATLRGRVTSPAGCWRPSRYIDRVNERAEIGVIGGSGFYEFLDSADEVRIETPYGPPSDPLVVGEIGGKRVAFLPRHGKDHRFPPHKIPYRANMWALRSVGVRQVLAPSAVGSLTASYGPGTLAVPDQRADADVLRAGRRGARPVRRSVLPGGAGDRDWRRARGRLGPGRVGDAGGDRGAAVLDAGRVEVVRRAGLDAHRHDRAAGGRARARDGALLHERRAGH